MKKILYTFIALLIGANISWACHETQIVGSTFSYDALSDVTTINLDLEIGVTDYVGDPSSFSIVPVGGCGTLSGAVLLSGGTQTATFNADLGATEIFSMGSLVCSCPGAPSGSYSMTWTGAASGAQIDYTISGDLISTFASYCEVTCGDGVTSANATGTGDGIAFSMSFSVVGFVNSVDLVGAETSTCDGQVGMDAITTETIPDTPLDHAASIEAPVDPCPDIDAILTYEGQTISVSQCSPPIDLFTQGYVGMRFSLTSDGWPDESSLNVIHSGEGTLLNQDFPDAGTPGTFDLFGEATDLLFAGGGNYLWQLQDSWGDGLGCTPGALCNPGGCPATGPCDATVPLACPEIDFYLAGTQTNLVYANDSYAWNTGNCGTVCAGNPITNDVLNVSFTNFLEISSSLDGVLATATDEPNAKLLAALDPANLTCGSHTITYTYRLTGVNVGASFTALNCEIQKTFTLEVYGVDISAFAGPTGDQCSPFSDSYTVTCDFCDGFANGVTTLINNPGYIGVADRDGSGTIGDFPAEHVDYLGSPQHGNDMYDIEWLKNGAVVSGPGNDHAYAAAETATGCGPITCMYGVRLICNDDASTVNTLGTQDVTIYPDPAAFAAVVVSPPDCAGGAGLVEFRAPDGTVCTQTTGTAGMDILTGCAAAQDGSLVWDFSTVLATNPCPGVPANVSGSVDAPCICLPIELLTFTGDAIKDFNELKWVTASEINGSHFEVERSEDGNEFELMDIVEAVGNTIETTAYMAVDEKPSSVTYYRLKIVDMDGSYDYSDVVTIERRKVGEPSIFPVPTTTGISVELELDQNTEVDIKIIDVLGRVSASNTYNLSEGNNVVSLEATQLPTGIFFVIIETEYRSWTLKAIKE